MGFSAFSYLRVVFFFGFLLPKSGVFERFLFSRSGVFFMCFRSLRVVFLTGFCYPKSGVFDLHLLLESGFLNLFLLP